MSNLHRTLALWLQLAIIASLCWPISILLAANLAGGVPGAESTLVGLLAAAVLAGTTTALAAWIVVRPEISTFGKWFRANLTGVPVAAFAGFAILQIESSRTGLLLGGLVAGAIADGFRLLSLDVPRRPYGPHLLGAAVWALVFIVGSLLAGPSAGAGATSHFLRVLLLGWGVASGPLVLSLVALSPLPRPGYPRRRLRWWV